MILPEIMVEHVISHLEIWDVLRLERVNKEYHDMTQYTRVWELLIQRDFKTRQLSWSKRMYFKVLGSSVEYQYFGKQFWKPKIGNYVTKCPGLGVRIPYIVCSVKSDGNHVNECKLIEISEIKTRQFNLKETLILRVRWSPFPVWEDGYRSRHIFFPGVATKGQ